MEVNYRSDLYSAGRTEDGEEHIAEVYYVYVQLADGSRYEHGHRFPSAHIVDWEDEESGESGFYFDDVTESAVANVEALVERIKAAGEVALDLKFWYQLDPEYGSAAYQAWEAQASKSELGYAS